MPARHPDNQLSALFQTLCLPEPSKAPESNAVRDHILKYAGAKTALDKLVEFGANKETILLSLEAIALGCERDNLESRAKRPKKGRAFYIRSEFHTFLKKAAEKIEVANKQSGLAIAIAVDRQLALYQKLPDLLRSYSEHFKRTRVDSKSGKSRHITRPKVFLAEYVRRATGNSQFELLATLVDAACNVAGLDTEYEAKAIEQAWRRNPMLRSSLFPRRISITLPTR